MLTLSLLLGVRTGTVPALFYQGILTSRETIVKRYFKIFSVVFVYALIRTGHLPLKHKKKGANEYDYHCLWQGPSGGHR